MGRIIIAMVALIATIGVCAQKTTTLPDSTLFKGYFITTTTISICNSMPIGKT